MLVVREKRVHDGIQHLKNRYVTAGPKVRSHYLLAIFVLLSPVCLSMTLNWKCVVRE